MRRTMRPSVNQLFNASNIQNLTGHSVATRFTIDLTTTTTRILAQSHSTSTAQPQTVINHSAQIDKRFLRTTIISNLTDTNISIRVAKIIPAPTVTRLATISKTSLKIVLSTSRGTVPSGNVGFFTTKNAGLPSTIRGSVRKLLTRPAPQPANPNIKHIQQLHTTPTRCISRLIASIPMSLRNLRIIISYTGKTTCRITPRTVQHLKTHILTVRTSPSNCGVGSKYKDARVSSLITTIQRQNTSIKVTRSNSTSHYLTISTRNHIVSNSRVVTILTITVHSTNALHSSAIITAIVSGLNFGLTVTSRNVQIIRAKINSHCILRTVLTGNCGLNNRRDKRIVLDSCTAANSKILATLDLLTQVTAAKRSLTSLTSIVAHLPRILIGITNISQTELTSTSKIQTIIISVRHRLNSANQILLETSNARPLVEIVIRTPATRITRTSTSHVTRTIHTRLTL